MANEEAGHLTEGTISVSAFRVYRNAFLGANPDKSKGTHTDWDDLDDDQQFAWFSVAERAIEILDDCENLPWVQFADQLFKVWARRMDYPIQEFAELSDAVRAAWVAVSRHITNLCALESGADIAEHEDRWLGAATRLGQAVGV